MPTGIAIQRDLICSDCPLPDGCDEDSLWCAFRWATDPNAAQQRVMLKTPMSKTKRKKLSRAIKLQKKREYNVTYGEAHKEQKRQYDRERYLRKKNSCTT